MIVMFCPNCGFQNADKARFCGKCGFAFKPVAAAAAAPRNPEPAQNSIPPAYAAPEPARPQEGAYQTPPPGNGAPPRTVTPEMLNKQWYYQIAQNVYGPASSVILLNLLQNNIIHFNTPVRTAPTPADPNGSGWRLLNQTMLIDIYYSGLWKQGSSEDVFASGVNAIKKTINNITGDSGKLNISFSQLFSDVFKKHASEEADQIFISGTSLTTPPESALTSGWPKPWLFTRVFLVLAASFALLWTCCLAFGYERASNVIPGMVFMGAMAVPFSVIIFFMELNVPRNISFYQIAKVFFIGGALSLLITLFLDQVVPIDDLNYPGALVTGIVEETGKLIAVLIFIRGTKTKYILNGLLIGAAVGAGFAVFETAGYALFHTQTFDDIIKTLFLRGFLSFGGHVAWAAITGAAIVMVKKDAPLSAQHVFSGKFLQLFIVPIILHFLWDSPISEYVPEDLSKLCPVQILLTVAAWFFLIKIINSGLKQIEEIHNQNTVIQA